MTRPLGRVLQRWGMSSTGMLIAPGIRPAANSLAGRTSTNNGWVFPMSSRSWLVLIKVGCFMAASASLHVTPPVWKLENAPPGADPSNPIDDAAGSEALARAQFSGKRLEVGVVSSFQPAPKPRESPGPREAGGRRTSRGLVPPVPGR